MGQLIMGQLIMGQLIMGQLKPTNSSGQMKWANKKVINQITKVP
jgi:hypothetical protein